MMDKADHNNKEHKEHKEFREQKEAQSQKPDVRINWDIEKKSLREENEKLKEENKSLNEKFLRLAADFDNARKRWEKDREETIKFGTYKILKDLIVFMDEMERAIGLMANGNHKDHQHTFVEGVAMTGNKLKDLLISEGTQLTLAHHMALELAREQSKGKMDTTAKAISQTYGLARFYQGVRAGDVRNLDRVRQQIQMPLAYVNAILKTVYGYRKNQKR